MIIVETKDGMVFVNNKETISCQHEKQTKTFYVKYAADGIFKIEDVERVRYVSDEKAIEIEDAGTALQNTRESYEKQLQELRSKYDETMKWANNLRSDYMALEEECGRVQDEVRRLLREAKDSEDYYLENMAIDEANKLTDQKKKQRWVDLHNRGFNFFHMGSNGEITEVPPEGWDK